MLLVYLATFLCQKCFWMRNCFTDNSNFILLCSSTFQNRFQVDLGKRRVKMQEIPIAMLSIQGMNTLQNVWVWLNTVCTTW